MVNGASAGIAASLKAVDCMSAEATQSAFTRLFGQHGALLPALTILLTLYVALFALLLLTGRARLSVGSLTPKMVMVGLVLTFTTSWVAYQGVVWNLAVGAPDQITGVLLGTTGSATQLFGDRIDILFNAIAEVATATQTPGAGDLMMLSAMLLMLGTVGILVLARIALAILLSVGPVFITLILFSGTRGLFAGWLRAVVLMAITPLFAVLGGVLILELAVPVVAGLRAADGIDIRAAMALFVVAAVHCGLMLLAIGVAATMVGGWRVFGLAGGDQKAARDERAGIPMHTPLSASPAANLSRAHSIAAALPSSAVSPHLLMAAGSNRSVNIRNLSIPATGARSLQAPPQSRRARGIGSRFASGPSPRRDF